LFSVGDPEETGQAAREDAVGPPEKIREPIAVLDARAELGVAGDGSGGFGLEGIFEVPVGVTVASPKQTEISVEGIDQQLVGQVAANIRAWRKPEPYKGKGIRYKDEFVFRKEGKKK